MHKRHALLAIGAALAAPAWALYDPKPNPLLVPAVGAWRGTLGYRDYQAPDRWVTLPSRLAVALAAPEELALYFVFDDGPGKTVYSYERMVFDFAANTVGWTSGHAKPSRTPYRLGSATGDDGRADLRFEREVASGVDRYLLELRPRSLMLSKTEQRSGRDDLQRSRYDYTRNEA